MHVEYVNIPDFKQNFIQLLTLVPVWGFCTMRTWTVASKSPESTAGVTAQRLLASATGNVSEPRLMLQAGSVRKFVCA